MEMRKPLVHIALRFPEVALPTMARMRTERPAEMPSGGSVAGRDLHMPAATVGYSAYAADVRPIQGSSNGG